CFPISGKMNVPYPAQKAGIAPSNQPRRFVLFMPSSLAGYRPQNLKKQTASPRTFEERADVAGARRVAQFAQRLSLNLTNAFTRYGEHLADFFEGALIAILKPESHADDAFLARAKLLQHRCHRLFEVQVHGCLRWRDYSLVFDEITKMNVFLFSDRSLEGYRCLSDLASLAD